MKKWLCLLLTLFITVPLMFGAAWAEGTPEWELDNTGMVLKKYNGGGGDIIIPATVDGNTVIRMDTGSIYRDRQITSIVMEEGIKSIGTNCLYKLDSLEKITFPQSLQVIGSTSLYDADVLKEVTVPASVRIIYNGFLNYCNVLEKVVFEGPCPMFENPSTTFSSLPDTAVVLVPDDQMQAYRDVLLNVKPEQIQPSGKNAGEQPVQVQFDFDPATGTLISCTTTDAWVNIPEQIDGVPVRAIGESAFAGCTYLFGVVIPEGVESIGNNAFENLNLIYAEVPDSVKTIGMHAFYYFRGASIHLPAGLDTISDYCYRSSSIDGALAIPRYVKAIGKEAFRATQLDEVVFPAGLESIGSKAFAACTLSRLCFETATLPELAEDSFGEQHRIVTVELPATASDEELQTAKEILTAQGMVVRVVRKPVIELQANISDEALKDLQEQMAALGFSATVVRNGSIAAADQTLETTPAPTAEPSAAPASEPTAAPTDEPTAAPAPEPTAVPTAEPTAEPAPEPVPQQNASSGGTWQKYKGVYYYVDASGSRMTGWIQDNGEWYYLDPQYNGAMKTGWLQLNKNWYYLNDNGSRMTGWLQVKGMWYYLDQDGVMQTGWIRDLDAEAKLDPPGSREIWHWCNSQGVMMADGFKKIDGRWEYFDKDGVWQPDVRP